jgi:multiple sugar transport system substrate-binding protein
MHGHMSRRGLLRGLGVVGLAGLAPLWAACGGQQPAAAPTTAPAAPTTAAPAGQATTAAKPAAPATTVAATAPKPAASGPVPVTIHFSAAARYAEFVAKHSQDYVAAKVPNAKIEVLDSPGHEEHFTKLLALQASGRLGDLAYAYPAQGWLGTFSSRGMFADHDDLAKKDNFDLKQYFDGGIAFSRVDGVLRSLPWHAHAEHWTWFLNLDAFAEAGVKPPPTEPGVEWVITDELTFGPALTKRAGDKVERFGVSPKTDYLGLMAIIRAFGGDVLSDDGKQVRLGEKPARAAIQWIHDRMYKHKYTPTAAQMEGNDQQMFIGGKMAILYGPGSIGPTMAKSIGGKFQMGVAPGPKGPPPDGKLAAGVGPNTMGLLSSSKNPDVAWQVLKLHTDKEAGVQKVLFGAGAPGGRPDVYDDPRLQENFPGHKVLKYQLGIGWPENLPWNLRGREMTTAVQQTLGNVWLNATSVDQGVDATVKAAEDVLKLTDVRKEK